MSKKPRRTNAPKRPTREGNVIHPAFDDLDWHPLDDKIDEQRDKKYVKNVRPRTQGQQELMEAINRYHLTLAIGPAGSGKTYLAVAAAVEKLEKGEVERIILSRPAMEAG
ncbi:MAG TPA: PhoH family protein, partial [Micavibrio sp.]